MDLEDTTSIMGAAILEVMQIDITTEILLEQAFIVEVSRKQVSIM